MKIEMIGYNDTKAIAIYGIIKMTPFLIASFFASLLSLIPAFVFEIYELLYLFIFPVFLTFIMLFQYIGNSHCKSFLKGNKIKHVFCLKDGIFYKDGKKIKSISDIRLYKYKNFIFLELKQSYYRIMNEDYISGSREEFLAQLKYYHKHYIAFTFPPKTEEEIINMLLEQIDLHGKERLFISPDKKRIVYIYKNSVGSYSIGREKISIAFDDDERYYLEGYGFWEPDWSKTTSSFFGTIEEALADIIYEIKDYIEFDHYKGVQVK